MLRYVGLRTLPQRDPRTWRMARRERRQRQPHQRIRDGVEQRGRHRARRSTNSQLGDLPRSRSDVVDTSAWGLVDIAGDHLSARYKAGVTRFQRGPGVFKIDWALSGPVPWSAEPCRRAADGSRGWHLQRGGLVRKGRGARPSPGEAVLHRRSSEPWSTTLVRPLVNTRCGRTVTCRTARTST